VVLYSPEWEALADALKCVVAATGVSEQQAKTDICNAMADRKIEVRVISGERTFSGGNVGVPRRLNPDDFDWSHSRPLKQWFIGPMPGQHYSWNGSNVPISLVEVSTADVREVLSNVKISSDPHNRLTNPRNAGAKPTKRQRAMEAMRRDINEGKLTPATLRTMLQKNLTEKYGVSRETACKARDQVLSEINSRQSNTQ
jgi:hypothetical protein